MEEGGIVAQDFIPDQDFKPDPPMAIAQGSSPRPGMGPPSFVPDSQFQADEDKYGEPGEQLKAGVEALARGATLGGSDFAETKLGISTPEAVRGRREANPVTSFLGEAVGSTAPILLTEGAAAPAALGVVAKNALIGGVLGAGNVVSDMALGEPNLNAQKILADIGGGIVAGAGFGLLEKGIQAIPAIWRGAAKEAPKVGEAATVAAGTAKPISSIDEAAQRLETAKKYGGLVTDSPQAAEAADALTRVDLGEWNPPEAQLRALADPTQPTEWSLAREMSGKAGETVRGIEAAQKQSAVSQLDRTIEELSPGVKPTADAAEAGKRATQAFTDQYQAEKEGLKPVFEALKATEVAGVDHAPGMVDAFTQAVPGVARMFDTEAGGLVIKPYQSNWGIAKSTYSAVKEAVESLQEGKTAGIEDLLNVRSGLKQHANVLEQGPGPAQIRSLGAAAMDRIQQVLDESGYNLKTRATLKDYAINEQEREIIEKTFGSSVGNQQFGAKAMKGLVNESIGDKMFANSANVRAAKKILSPDKFNESLANWISEYREKSTDKGVFSSNKFNSFLRKNEDALKEAFAGNPSFQRIKDLTTAMRILPDAPSINPSGTAKTVVEMVKHAAHAESLYAVLPKLLGGARDLLEGKMAEFRLNQELAGRASQSAQLKTLQGVANRMQEKISSGARAVWGSPLPKSLVIEGGERLSKTQFDETTDRLKQLSADPNALLDHMSTSTEALAHAAPNITQGIQSTITRGVQFLTSKIPTAPQSLLLSHPYEPSRAEIQKFGTYLNAVNHPVSALTQVKKAQLSPETMEALQVVHPHLLEEMRKEVMTRFTPDKAKDLSFAHKSALSQFLGQPLTENMTPMATAQNQIVYASPNRSTQSAPKVTRASIAGMRKLDTSGRAATETQRERED